MDCNVAEVFKTIMIIRGFGTIRCRIDALSLLEILLAGPFILQVSSSVGLIVAASGVLMYEVENMSKGAEVQPMWRFCGALTDRFSLWGHQNVSMSFP